MSNKKLQFCNFVDERRTIVSRNFTFSNDSNRITFLSGERLGYVNANLKILDRYMKNFLNIRQSDIDAQFADKNDRESVGSRSFSHHMKPNMLTEFDTAWKIVSNYLQYDVFFESDKKFPSLPVISNNGNVNYKDIINIKKEKETDISKEYMTQTGPIYAPSFVFTPTEPIYNYPVNSECTLKDAWDLSQ